MVGRRGGGRWAGLREGMVNGLVGRVRSWAWAWAFVEGRAKLIAEAVASMVGIRGKRE